jgi:hypothetical protein
MGVSGPKPDRAWSSLSLLGVAKPAHNRRPRVPPSSRSRSLQRRSCPSSQAGAGGRANDAPWHGEGELLRVGLPTVVNGALMRPHPSRGGSSSRSDVWARRRRGLGAHGVTDPIDPIAPVRGPEHQLLEDPVAPVELGPLAQDGDQSLPWIGGCALRARRSRSAHLSGSRTRRCRAPHYRRNAGGPCRPRPGPRGHLVERRLQAARAEHLVRRVEDPVALLTGAGAQAPENRPPNGMYPAFR